jgi:unsaturated rhamnogalacturonyl hydrolase
MKLHEHLFCIVIVILCSMQAGAQEKDDVNTPLHLLPANYPTPYKAPDKVLVKGTLDRIFIYINQNTHPELIDTVTGKKIDSPESLTNNVILKKGTFRITSYEWGVVYSALLNAYKHTGDKNYVKYVKDRHEFIAHWAGVFREKLNKGEMTLNTDFPLRQPVAPHALDDGGAVAASMIKASMQGLSTILDSQIKFYLDYISQKEFRFPDRTIARNRPLKNTLWLDDLYMALPALVQMAKYNNKPAYFDDAIYQLESYSSKMFVPSKGLFMHGWVQGMQTHPAFHWARANGWALLTMTELLDALPANHPKRNFVLNLFRKHVEGLVKLQDGTGFWHQLLDRPDSYLETSATAIYTYCIAKACNEGWLDKLAYAPVVALGWNAASSKVNAAGQVEGTCVGTGMAFDPAFYYHRPVSKFAAHGYGPLIYAASEVFRLLDKGEFKINDSALIFYPKD